MYRQTKRDLLYQILFASRSGGRHDIEVTSELVDSLMSPIEFRKLFEGGREANEGFYAFSNHIQSNEEDFRRVIFKFKVVARQLDYILHTFEIRDIEQLEQLRRIEQALFEMDLLHADYNDEKELSGLIWNVFADWSLIDGYRKNEPRDLIERAIDGI